MSEHHHHHDEEECCCGEHHEHEHHHHDEEECCCGEQHDHKHHHHHHDEEECCCGEHHEHKHHHHHHDEEECCREEHCEHEHEHGHTENGVYIEQHMHEGACVVSGKVLLCCDYEALRSRISEKLTAISEKVNEIGGIIGHIKASAEVKSTEMFSVTEGPVMVKTAPENEIELRLAAIVFLIEPDELEPMIKQALTELKDAS